MMMASSSSSSFLVKPQISQTKYDVFLSFRGEDTRHNFTSHLHAALSRKNIEAFIDDQLRRGDEISQSLLDAIEASMTFIVIFSKDYASSSWCLDELVKILECKNKYRRSVIPVFYHVNPSNVRKLTGIFGDGFMKLVDKKQCSKEKLQIWSCALSHAGKISGYHVSGQRSEYTFIEEIVDDILKKLNDTFSIPRNDSDHLVGLHLRIKEIESLLSDESKDILILGIWGTGGIGKTTIADAIFNKISNCFEGSCFISNVRGEEEKDGGLNHLRRQLLSTLLIDQIVKNGVPNIGLNFECKRLNRKKVLIILDDVTRFEQIELLIGGLQFAIGSRIIITTRDKHVLNVCMVDFVYEMERLTDEDAFKLFSRHAFRQNNPDVGFEELSNKVISYAGGIPLALKVLGRFLVKRDKEEWESAINKLTRIPNMDILNVLQISYESLDEEEKKIFLDIACFLKGMERDLVVKFLDACGFSGQIGIRVLIDKSLLSISKYNIIEMHDLLQEMGKEIVRQESVNDLGKRSRLWHQDDVYKVLTCNMGTDTIEGILLDMSQVKEFSLDPDVFTKMPKLRLLRFYGENKFKVSSYISIFSRFLNMSYFQGSALDKLRYFEWHGYPLNTMPPIIRPENLVSIEMPYSNIKQLWNGVQPLGNLKRLSLDWCKQLGKIPDLSLAQNLELLDLRYCTSLIEIHSSIQLLNKLEYLSILYCSNLKWFPCVTSPNLKHLDCCGTAIEEVPSSIEGLSRLEFLDLSLCEQLKHLPCNLHQLKSLKHLYLDSCPNLQGSYNDGFHSLHALTLRNCGIKELPENIFGKHLSSLKELDLEGNDFERIPESIVHLPEELSLSLSNCRMLKYLPKLPYRLFHLNVYNCTSLESLSGLFKSGYLSSDQLFQFQNCLKLDQDELKILEKDVLRKFWLRFTRWYNSPQSQVSDTYASGGETSYPGSEIPEWFRYQSIGSSIIVKLPPSSSSFNNNQLGFVFCVIITVPHYPKGYRPLVHFVNCECKLKTKDGDWHNFSDISSFYVGSIDDYVRSDHILLGYHFGNSLRELYDNEEAIFQFYFGDRNGVHIESCLVIKKCGVHLFLSQDVGESSEHYKEVHELQREEPHPKRLKY